MLIEVVILYFDGFCFKQKTSYEMRISDWSSDVCSSDLSQLLTRPKEPQCSNPWLSPPLSWPSPKSVTKPNCLPCCWPRAFANPGRSSQIGRASCRERVCQYV